LTGYVVEGQRAVSEEKLDRFLESSLKSIKELSNNGKDDFHFACKFTAYVGSELMEKMTTAQELYDSLLQITFDPDDESVLTRE